MSASDDLLNALNEEDSIIIAEVMDDDMKKSILEYEMKRLNEFIPFINKGMEEAFKEKEAIVIVLDNNIKSKERWHRRRRTYKYISKWRKRNN